VLQTEVLDPLYVVSRGVGSSSLDDLETLIEFFVLDSKRRCGEGSTRQRSGRDMLGPVPQAVLSHNHVNPASARQLHNFTRELTKRLLAR
jgi:hypothetical protein